MINSVDIPNYSSEQIHIFDNVPGGVLINVDNGQGGLKFAYANAFLAESLDYTLEEFETLLQENPFAAIYDADWGKTKTVRSEVEKGKIVDSITRQKKKDGSAVWILAHTRKIRLDGKDGLLFLFSQIQNLIGLQNELSQQNKAWYDIMQSVPIGLLVYKEENGVRTILSINSSLIAFANAVGSQMDSKARAWNEAEFAMILNQDIYAFTENEDIPLVAGMLKESETKPVSECTYRLRGSTAANATTVYIHCCCASKQTEKNCRTYYVTYENVTGPESQKQELMRQQEALYQMSYYDAMTGVKNRNAYNELTRECIMEPLIHAGIAFCDINGLKKTNDTLGHYYGDKLICQFANILLEFFDKDDIYRLSGDEFEIICNDISQKNFQSKMKQVLARIEEKNKIASIGYIWKDQVSDLQRRTSQAEAIMYVEKQNYYENSQSVKSKHRPQVLNTLLKEFEEGRFVMFLQPKVAIDGSRVIGAEALARKYDSKGNLYLPYVFVPQLERGKLIPKLDFYMLEQTCIFLQEEHQAGNDDFSVSVNVSRVTIVENEFIETVTNIINQYDFLRENLELELTESNQTLDADRLKDYLAQLKELGVKISLDDMGNDYASLSLLSIEEFDWVKLDRSLILELGQERAAILIKNVINTCHELDLKVIAEGVETDDVRLKLKEMGCDAYQGYLKSKPISVEEFKERFL